MAARNPRVNAAKMADHVGQMVTLVGKVTSVNGGEATLEASDKGVVHVKSLDGSAQYNTAFVQIIGRVSDPTNLEVMNVAEFGEDFDMDNYDKLVNLWHNPALSALF